MSRTEWRDVRPMAGEESSGDGHMMGRSEHGENESYRGGGAGAVVGRNSGWWAGQLSIYVRIG